MKSAELFCAPSAKIIVGFDEAGRGPLAGPVSAGAVILPDDFPLDILNDSKKMSEARREKAEAVIKEKALWGFATVDHATIDRINILQASLLAMRLAFDDMLSRLDSFCDSRGFEKSVFAFENLQGISDGNFCPEVPIECRAEVKADSKFPQVMAASIIAKVGRDRLMCEYDALYPEYGYARHKGYPTQAHKEICRRLGPSPIQRLTFKY
ncbi:MAG: ribonuclease HII [Treponemataceae bacterium]|nr:ribonuclease HII [Treponemataceae bacterium]